MADYDIGAAFSEIEDELISSMIRNLKRHQVEELTEGFEWTQWQALQIQALEDYKRKAAQKFGAKFSSINDKIDDMLTKTYNDSATVQEQQILRAIKKGLPQTMTANVGTGVIQGEFFKTNDRKLDALIKATKNDMQKAEYAVLRMTDDKYRKIIFNAQVYANTGAGTYAKAVDMATKDFLAAGINCIQYKNGRRVNIVSYAEMAIRTANKRAYLQGEGEMRKKWGIHTVILNQRVNACPKCSRFVGKVIVDDVWSGGTAKEAEKSGYLLMSDCIKQGLYHPNCQDSHTTYFGDILSDEDEEETNEQSEEEQASSDDNAQSTITETSQNEHIEQLESNGQITPQRQRINEQLYDAEQQQNYCEYQANKYDRLSKYSLDEDNQRRYSARKSEWEEKLAQSKDTIEEIKQKIALDEEKRVPIKTRNATKRLSAVSAIVAPEGISDIVQKFSLDTNNSSKNEEKTVANSAENDIIETEGQKAIREAFQNSKSSKVIVDTVILNHTSLADYTPESMKKMLEAVGYDVKPLGSKSSLKGIPFEDGGGYRISFGGDGYFQYHPAKGSHHDDAYWKIGNGERGMKRYDMDGNPKN